MNPFLPALPKSLSCGIYTESDRDYVFIKISEIEFILGANAAKTFATSLLLQADAILKNSVDLKPFTGEE